MQAEIIAIGDEILIGQTVDTNSTFIAKELNSIGIKVFQKRVIADDQGAIKNSLDSISSDTKIVFMTGGLGPTKDDITKITLNEYFDGEMVFHPEVYEHIIELFKSFNRVPSDVNRNQAFLPSTCKPVPNALGTAVGMHFERNGVHFFSLPGVPFETEHLVSKKIIPWLSESLGGGQAYHKTVITQGLPESDLAEKLESWENNLPTDIKLAYLPSPGMVKLRLSSYDRPIDEAKSTIASEIKALKNILGSIIFGEDAESVQEILGILLQEQGATLSTAESCTGGYIAHLMTSMSGSSKYFNGSIVSYANSAKEELLDVDAENIKKFGAVSQAVVEKMALSSVVKLKSTYAIATSGIAGPTGATKNKPVGTVWIAVAGPFGVESKKYSFGKNRMSNINKTAIMAMDMLKREMQKIVK